MNRIWSTIEDPNELKNEVERQVGWSLDYLDDEMDHARAVGSKERMEELEKARKIIIGMPEIVSNNLKSGYNYKPEFLYH